MNDSLLSPMDPERVARAFEFLIELRKEIVQEADELFEKWRPTIRRRSFVPSALNLLRYVLFRRRDLSSLQGELALLGLSSLGRGEPRILANLDAVLATLGVLAGADANRIPARPRPSRFYLGERLLERAMGERAECVMLNKGPYVEEAVAVLDDLLTRMARHQYKKTPTLRPLHF